MVNCWVKAIFTQPTSKLFGNMDGPVPPAGAAKGNVYIGLTLRVIEGQKIAEQIAYFFHRCVIGRISFDIMRYTFIQPRKRPKYIVPMRIAQETQVKNQIGIVRNAA